MVSSHILVLVAMTVPSVAFSVLPLYLMIKVKASAQWQAALLEKMTTSQLEIGYGKLLRLYVLSIVVARSRLSLVHIIGYL